MPVRTCFRWLRRVFAGILSLSPLWLFLISALSFGIIAIVKGQDACWDLHNYHFYNGYAFLNETDNLIPAQIQTFINPIIDVPIYLIMSYLPPVIGGGVLGIISGINFVLLYFLVGKILLSTYPDLLSIEMCNLLAFLCTILGISAPMFVSEIGTTMGDSFTAAFVLASLLFIFPASQKRFTFYAFMSGVLIGIAVGLKLTNAAFMISLVLCGWWLERGLLRSLKSIALFVAGATVSIVGFQGYWSWHLFRWYQNPLFPYYNDFFKSPFADEINWKDLRFMPKSIGDALLYPFEWAIGHYPSAELPFRDLRYAIIMILFASVLVYIVVRFFQNKGANIRRNAITLLLFITISYGLWISSFAIQRYFIVFELLSGIIIFLLLEIILSIRKSTIILFLVIVAICIGTTSPANWGRKPWNSSWFALSIPLEAWHPNQMVIMLGYEPIAYMIPYFPKDTRFVRVEGNFIPSAQTRMAQIIRREIERHNGPLFCVDLQTPNDKQTKLLESYGLKLGSMKGYSFTSKIHPSILLYPLARIK